MLDIFNDDAFSVRELSAAVMNIPNQWGRIGEMGLFVPKGIRTTTFMVEMKNGVIQLVQSSDRGTNLPAARRGKRDLRPFSTFRFGLKDSIKADDVQGLRAFGEQSVMVQIMDMVLDRQSEIRSSIDITREYLRAGALQGQVKDADGSVLADLFSDFGVTQKVVDFKFGTPSTDLGEKVEEVVDHIRLNLMGDVMSHVHCLATPTFWNKLMRHEDFRRRFEYFEATRNPGRENVSGGFEWKGVMWEKYLAEGPVPQEDGTTVTQSFIPDGDARFFPVGTRSTFQQINAPADYIDTVNTLGQEFYSDIDIKKRWVDVEVQSNTMPMCHRPAILVRGHSSD